MVVVVVVWMQLAEALVAQVGRMDTGELVEQADFGGGGGGRGAEVAGLDARLRLRLRQRQRMHLLLVPLKDAHRIRTNEPGIVRRHQSKETMNHQRQ